MAGMDVTLYTLQDGTPVEISYCKTGERLGRLFVGAGNICAGKSHMTRALGFPQFVEPGEGTNPWLPKFYSDPKRYGEVMQAYILRQRFLMLMDALKLVLQGHDVYMDRQVWDDSVFVEANWKNGDYSQEGYEEYHELRNYLIEELQFPTAFVYLDVDVDECLRRNRQMRQNDCESGLTSTYLKLLEEGYKRVEFEAKQKQIPWFTLDWNHFGTLEKIIEAVEDCPHYTTEARWFKKLQEPQWVTTMLSRLDAFFEAAKEKSDNEYLKPEKNVEVLQKPEQVMI